MSTSPSIFPGTRRLLFIAGLLCLSKAWSHEVRPAYLQITENVTAAGQLYSDVLWKQPVVQGGRLAIEPRFPEHCKMEITAPPEVTTDALLRRWTTDCALDKGTIHIEGLSVTLTDVLVRFDKIDGEGRNYLLRPEHPNLDLAGQTASSLNYLWIGIEHLLSGVDHVLFIVGLVLFIQAPWMLVKTVTAFTVSHSITLLCAMLNWIALEQAPVEAVIALSILFLARELLLDESKRSRLTLLRPWVMAFIFGLLHGLGFAGALADVGLPRNALWSSLLLFNIGIELGQLLVIGLLLGLIRVARLLSSLPRALRLGAYGMGCMAAYWTIDRTLLLI